VSVRTAHTAELDAATLRAARALLEDVFAGELTAEDWEHCLGGIHALAYDGDELVGHAAVVQRRLLHAGRALRAGYVEGVAVRRDARRRGHGDAMMAALERVIVAAYDLGALGSSDDGLPFYRARGWRPWDGPLRIMTPDGLVETPEEEGWILVFGDEVHGGGELICADFRDGDVW
jgi:aminoglycoside 2'-N-acetyltransferase I